MRILLAICGFGLLSAWACDAFGAFSELVRIERGEAVSQRVKLPGGKRACVIFAGDHDPVQDLEIEVKDARGRIVARSGGQGEGDMLCAIFYPERDGEFTVIFRNGHAEFNNCIVVVK